MSQRSIRRGQQRRLAVERRREALRLRRATLAAIGATALFAPAAQAANFEVNDLGDGAPDACDANCTLRDAVTLANANSEADTITFSSTLTGQIQLTEGELPLGSPYALTITGPGKDVLAVSGDADGDNTRNSGDSRIFSITDTGAVKISDLTMTEGYGGGGNPGGAVAVSGPETTITDAAITDSAAPGSGGGGIQADGALSLVRTVVSGNSADQGGGVLTIPSGPSPQLTVSDSTISGNTALQAGGIAAYSYATISATKVIDNHATAGDGGGILAVFSLTMTGSTLSGNTSTGAGGGVAVRSPYSPLDVADSVVSGNSAGSGGGFDIDSSTSVGLGKYGVNRKVTGTTIAGNHATGGDGGGIRVATLANGDQLTVSHSTVSSNDAVGFGGGIAFDGQSDPIRGAFDLTDSTVSGNSAPTGGGVSIGKSGGPQFICSCGSIGFDNSTIAANAAATAGGGLYLASYDDPNPPGTARLSPTIPLTSTIVADNTAAGASQDLDRADDSTSGGFDLSFSLVEAKGDAPLTETPAGSNIVGTDPQLGPLADNGGATKTHLPAQASAAIDKGKAPARLLTDQRGKARTVDGDPANAPGGGDGTDIGAVEIPDPPITPKPPEPTPPTPKPPKNVAPQAFIKTNHLGAKNANRRRAAGIAIDDNKVAKVDVALVYKSGGNCRDLLPSGHFSAAHRCGRPRAFITAKGTKKWSFALNTQLTKGYYVLYARATDDKGLKQTAYGTKSRRPFRVK